MTHTHTRVQGVPNMPRLFLRDETFLVWFRDFPPLDDNIKFDGYEII